MASKTVSSIVIALETKGAEKIGGLKSSLRDLGKATTLSGKELGQLRKDILDVGKSLNGSEQAIKGQIVALEGLQKQVSRSGFIYSDLKKDITALKSELFGLSQEAQKQSSELVRIGSSSSATAAQIQRAIKGLRELRGQATQDSQAFFALTKDIDNLTGSLSRLQKNSEEQKKENALLVGGLRKTAGQLKLQSRVFAQRVEFLQKELDALDLLTKKEKELTANKEKRARVESDLAKRSRKSIQTRFLSSVAEGRKQVIALASAFNDADRSISGFNKRLEFLDKDFGKIPDTAAGVNQELRELQERFYNTSRSAENYVAIALQVARVQREASAATQGLGAALINDLASGVAAKNQRNLREAIGQLQAEMSELNTETTEGSAKYAENARQVNNLQKELDQIANSYRNVADMTRRATASQVDYGAVARKMYLERDQPGYKTPAEIRGKQFLERIDAERQVLRQTLALPAAGQTSAPGTGALRSGGAEAFIPRKSRLGGGGVGIPARPQPGDVQAISAKRYMGPQATPEQLEANRRAYISQTEALRANAEAKKAAAQVEASYLAEIHKARKANDGSINSSNRLRAAIIRVRDTLPTTSKEFAKYTEEINNLDRESERVSRRMSRRRMSPMQMTQAAGAAISGGIFGGPEGLLGGAIGALGGVGGAFAGAAIGAQVGGLRRQLGEFADYAAEIKRLEIALKGITEVQDDAVASQANYSRAVAAAADVTKDLNVPQEVAIRGITRLTAAVKGAGGGVADAELAFKNITSAITATGGGAEQVQGAVTALVQIFSKGKVSAEEINQIAERLPGTFNKIAEASGRTGPELTKALQKGEVGLNDLMKFLVQLGGEYGELAEKIAGSSEAAGQRLQVAYNNMRIEIGNALQPIGAEFQDAFTEFIRDITPTLVAVLPKIGEFFLLLAKNIDTVVVAMTGALAVFAVGKIAAIVASIGSLSAAFFTLKLNAIVATKALIGLNGAALLNPYTALAAGVAAFATNLFLAAKEQKRLNTLIREGSVADVESEISTLRTEKAKLEPKVYLPGPGTTQLNLRHDANASRLKQIDDTLGKLEERLRTARIDATQGADLSDFLLSGQLTQFEKTKTDDTGGGTGGGTGDKGPKSQLEQLKAQYESRMRSSKGVLEIETMRQQQALQLARATADNNQKLITTTNLNNISLDFAEKEIQIENKLLDALSAANRLELEENQIQARLNAQLEYQIDMKRLLLQTDGAIAGENQRAAIAAEATSKALSDQVFSLREQLGLVTDSERIDRFRQDAEKQFGKDDPNVAKATDLFRQTVAPTFAEGLGQKIRELKKDLMELVNPINQITFAANTIGTAFSQAFGEVITGSKSIKEALSDAFASIGKAFINMATQIIAKQLVLITLGTIMKALGIGLGGAPDAGDAMDGGGSLPLIANPGESVSMNAAGSLQLRANGGPVNANQPYIVGERGPELFIPFQQGDITSNEELKAQMREASSAPMAFAKPGADGKNGDDTISTSERRLLERSYADRLRETREERSYADRLQETREAREERADRLRETREERSYADRLQETREAREERSYADRLRETREERADRLRETREERSYADRLRETREERSYADRLRETREVMLPFTRSAEQASIVAAERETAQAISNPGPIDVRYESTVVNGVEYVTAEQHQAGMAQAAERGRALTLAALQNSVKTRRKVGL